MMKKILLFILLATQLNAYSQLSLDFSHKRGFYDNAFQLTISTNDPSATIRYTTDGDKPSVSSGTIYSGPISITTTSYVRAIAYRTGVDTTKVKTHTFIFLDDVLKQGDERPSGSYVYWTTEMDQNISNTKSNMLDIPTISIVSPYEDLFGINGIHRGQNLEKDMEIECSIEMIYPANYQRGSYTNFQENCGIKIQGGGGRWDNGEYDHKQSFGLRFRKQYSGNLKNKIFSDAPLNGDSEAGEYDKLVLRAGHNKSWGINYDADNTCYTRDQLARDLQIAAGGYGSHGTFVHLYLNGLYWGLYNPCERLDDAFMASYFGGEEQDYFFGKAKGGYQEGSSSRFDQWKNTISSTNDFKLLQDYLDVNNFIDMTLINVYSATGDFPQYYFGNGNNPAGPIRFFNWDSEDAFGGGSKRSSDVPQVDRISSINNQTSGAFNNMWKNNIDFRTRFYDRAYKHCYNNGTLTDENVTRKWLSLNQYIENAIVAESARWGDERSDERRSKNQQPYVLTKEDPWQGACDRVTNSTKGKAMRLIEQLRKNSNNGYPYYPSIDPPLYQNNSINIEVQKMEVNPGFQIKLKNPNNSGTIYYTTDGSDPRLSGGAVAPGAKAYNGETVSIDNPLLLLGRVKDGSEWSALHCLAFFVKQNLSALKVTEIMYHPPVWQDVAETELEFIELKNTSTTETLNLSGLRFVDGIDFEFPMGTTLAPQEFIVLASSKEMLLKKCPGLDIFGEYLGQLRNSGEWIKAATFGGDTVIAFEYSDQAPWSQLADGLGYSLVSALPDPVGDQNSADQWTVSADNTCGSPGEDDPNSSSKGLRAFFTMSERTVCAGETVTFTNATSGAEGNISYEWNFGSGASPATATGEGPHSVDFSTSGTKNITLKVSDDNGTDEVSSEVAVNPPVVAEITGDNSICGAPEQDFIAFGDEWKYFKGNSEASSPTDAWTKRAFDDNNWESGPSPFWYDNGSGGTLLSDMKDNYTTLFLRKKINVSGAPAIDVLDLTADYDDGFVVWINGNKVLTVNGPANPVYDTLALQDHESGTSEQFTIANASEYLQEGDNVIAAMGFNKSAGSSDFHFNLALSYDGQKTTLTASGGTQYQWSTGENASSITVSPTQTTTYTVTVSQGGCTDVASQTVAVGSLLPEIVQNNNLLSVSNISNATAYRWFLDGQPIQGATDATYTPSQNGVYTVEVTDNAGCSGTSHDYHFVLNGLVENENDLFKVYPNPTNGKITIELYKLNDQEIMIEIYNYLGEKVLSSSEKVSGYAYKKQLDISGSAAGIYQMIIKSGKTNIQSRKFIKE